MNPTITPSVEQGRRPGRSYRCLPRLPDRRRGKHEDLTPIPRDYRPERTDTMAERSTLRGSRLGATSYEDERGVEFADRQTVSYDCALGHRFEMTFAVGGGRSPEPCHPTARSGPRRFRRCGPDLCLQLVLLTACQDKLLTLAVTGTRSDVQSCRGVTGWRRTMRVGVIGAGRIGALHAANLADLTEIDEVVITDRDRTRAAQVSDRIGAATTDDATAAVEAGIDAAVIATPTPTHADLVLMLARAGLPVFCEKPVASDVASTIAVLKEVEAAGTALQVGFQRRFDAGYQALRDAVRAGRLGRLHGLHAVTADPAPPPASYIASSGGIFRDCSVHDFDAIRWVTGREVVEVYATGANRGDELFARAGDVDTSAAVLTMDDGTLVLVSNTRYNPRGHDVRLELHGSRDSIAVGPDDHLPLRSVEPGVSFPSGEPYQFFMDRFRPAYRAELEAFTEVVAGRRPSPCTVADALEAGWIAEACTTSLELHRPVRMEEVRP